MELGKKDEALSQYKKATSDQNDVYLTPLYMERMALVYEQSGDTKKAIETYQEIKTKYATSAQSRNAEKYLARLGDYSL